MSGAIRLVVSDIDGTLTRSDKTLSDAVVAAVGRLGDAGVAFSLISARPPSGIAWIAERLKLPGNIAAFNGGTILDASGRILSAERLSRETAAHALAALEHPAIEPWLFADGNWYARTTENSHVPRERLSASVEPVIVADFDALLDRVDKIVGVSDQHDALAELEPQLAAELAGAATVARSQLYYLDVTAVHANKGDGIVKLAEAAGVPLAGVAVLGDQRNDLPMFARAGLSIAMGQGPEEVRAAASQVTLSNDEDGVAHAIDTILLPMVTA